MSEPTDREAYAALLNSLSTARDSARSLGLLRSDTRWIAIAGIFDQVRDNATRLMLKTKSEKQHRLWMPPAH